MPQAASTPALEIIVGGTEVLFDKVLETITAPGNDDQHLLVYTASNVSMVELQRKVGALITPQRRITVLTPNFSQIKVAVPFFDDYLGQGRAVMFDKIFIDGESFGVAGKSDAERRDMVRALAVGVKRALKKAGTSGVMTARVHPWPDQAE